MIATQFHWSNVDKMFVWEVVLPPINESGTRCRLEIRAGNHTKSFDIIFGDVWFCTGQSNMLFRMDQIANSTQEIKEGEEDNIV